MSNMSIIDKLTTKPADMTEHSSILNDIANLLNVKLQKSYNLQPFDEANDSILSYGLPNFTQYTASQKNISEQIARDIHHTLTVHEPRLRNIDINVSKIENHSLSFTIAATLLDDPEPIKIQFDSEYKPSLQQFAINDREIQNH